MKPVDACNQVNPHCKVIMFELVDAIRACYWAPAPVPVRGSHASYLYGS